jgi:phosphatidylserine/phosphatidylglycerophosphate/cardiolipin synthase-like enzyme
VLVGNLSSKHAIATIKALRTAGVAVRVLTKQYMHEKYVDAGSLVYVGSANLSRYGLDCAYEVGIVADAEELGPGAVALRERFDALWSGAVPWKPSARPVL